MLVGASAIASVRCRACGAEYDARDESEDAEHDSEGGEAFFDLRRRRRREAATRRRGPIFSWLSLTSGLFDRLIMTFSPAPRPGNPQNDPVFCERLLTHRTNFHEVGNSEAILAGNAISLHIMTPEENRVIRKSLF